jgi:hypothetical protein
LVFNLSCRLIAVQFLILISTAGLCSGLSVLIRELERQLGFRLFDRTTRQVALSDGLGGHPSREARLQYIVMRYS